jgi:glyoxylate reductase
MAKVFVTREVFGPGLARLQAAHDVDVWPGSLPPTAKQLRSAVADIEGLLCLLTDRIDSELLDGAPRLRAIANYAVGSDNIDLVATRGRGIAVGVTPDALTEATADLTFALLLAAARRLPEAAGAIDAGDWQTWRPDGWLGSDVYGATLGIIGFGRIGRAVARRAEGFDMTVIATPETALGDILERSDFVSLHCPLTPQTRHLIDAAALARMRPTAILVNTARGGVVDQPALIEALRAGTIAAAALDVTDPEPPLTGDPLLEAPNLLLLPHIGSATRTARGRMTDLAVANLLAALNGQPMPHPAA